MKLTENSTSLSAIVAVLEQKKNDILVKTAINTAASFNKRVSENINVNTSVTEEHNREVSKFIESLNEAVDFDKLKMLTKANPGADDAALAVLKAISINPKQNKQSLMAKMAAEHNTTVAKLKQILFGAMGISLDDDVSETTNELVEDWVPLAKVKPADVEKVKTKKSGNNYFYVVSVDTKEKEFEVVTPKQYNDGNTEKTMTFPFADVVMVSTDDLPESPEKGGKKPSGVIKHTARHDVDSDED